MIITGPCGVGKSFLACALAQKAVRDGFTALYTRAPRLLRDLGVARADGSFGTLLDRIARIDVLVVDDWAMAPLADSERRDFLEICDDRYATRSTVLTSQVPITHWHDQIGDPTVADSILDRLVHNAHRSSCRALRCANPKTTSNLPPRKAALNDSASRSDPGALWKLLVSTKKEKKQKESKIRKGRPVETAAAMEIHSGGLRRLFLDEFPRLLEKACAKTAPAFSQLHTGPAAINLSIHFLDGGRGTQL